MPYESIADAGKAGFPCSIEDINLTLSQINKLAEFYDAIKKAGSVDNPMAVAWTQWKETYKKEDKKWVLAKKKGEQETNAKWIPVAKKDQRKVFEDGSKIVLCENILKNNLDAWKGGRISINHKGTIEGLHILDAKYKNPFLYMRFDEATERLFRNTDASGWSVEFDPNTLEYDGENVIAGIGAGISILYPDHYPACTKEMGCHETFEFEKGNFEGDKMEEESKVKSIVDDIKGMFEQLMAIVKKDKKEELNPKKTGEKENMDKVEEMTLELKTATEALAKSKGEFETMQTDHAKEVKEMGDKVAAFEQEKLDAAKVELNAQWEQLKKEVIPPGLVAKDEDAEKLKGEFEQHPHAFIQRMATFKDQKDQKEEGAEFESESDESIKAVKELKEDTGRI